MFTPDSKRWLKVLSALVALIAVVVNPDGVAREKPRIAEESFEIPLGGDLAMLPMALGGVTGRFVIDTSARFTSVDVALQGHLGDKVRRIPSLREYGITEDWTYQCPTLRVGQTEFRPAEVVSTDLRTSRAAGGHRYDGHLGLDCLESLVLDLDCDAGNFQFWNSPAPDQICRGIRKKIVLGDNPKCLYLYNSIPGLQGVDPEAFVISTACGDSVGLRDEIFDLLVKNGTIDGERSVPTSLKNVRGTTGRLHGFTFAGKTFGTLRCSRMPLNVIGLGLLSRFHVVIDIPQNVMWLEPGARIDVPDRSDLSGLGFVRFVTNEVVILEVEAGSPSAEAGLRRGDQIIGVRDIEIGKGSLFRLRQRLCESGPCEISLLRGETAIKVVLDLK